jgi:hypothetical protein
MLDKAFSLGMVRLLAGVAEIPSIRWAIVRYEGRTGTSCGRTLQLFLIKGVLNHGIPIDRRIPECLDEIVGLLKRRDKDFICGNVDMCSHREFYTLQIT